MRKFFTSFLMFAALYYSGQPESLHAIEQHNSEQWQFQVSSRQTLEQFATFDYYGTIIRFPLARYQNHRHVIWLTSQPESSDGYLSYVFEGPVVLERSVPGVEVEIHYKGNNLYQVDLYFSGTKVLTEREIWLVGRGELQRNLVVSQSSILDLNLQPLQSALSKACNQWDRSQQFLEHAVGYMAPERKLTQLEQEQKEWLANPVPGSYLVQINMMTNETSDDQDSAGTGNNTPDSPAGNDGSTEQATSENSQNPSASNSDSPSVPLQALVHDQPQPANENPSGWCEHCQTVHTSGDIAAVERVSFALSPEGLQINSRIAVATEGVIALGMSSTTIPANQLTEENLQALVVLAVLQRLQNSQGGGTQRCRPEEDLPRRREDDDQDDDYHPPVTVPVRQRIRSPCERCIIL